MDSWAFISRPHSTLNALTHARQGTKPGLRNPSNGIGPKWAQENFARSWENAGAGKFRLLKRIDSMHLDRTCLRVERAEDAHFLSGVGFDKFRFIQPVHFVFDL